MVRTLKHLLPAPKNGKFYQYHNIGVDTSYEKLNKLLKTKKFENEAEWNIEITTPEGDKFYGMIYDRKKKRQIENKEVIRWYITALSVYESKIIKENLERLLKHVK